MEKKARILVVDDDPMIGEMLKDVLEYKGFWVKVSRQPEHTVENIQENDIQLVLLDKLISGVDGTDICINIRKVDQTREIPVIMMTALHNAKEICLEAGATDFLSKPFDIETMENKIKQILNLE